MKSRVNQVVLLGEANIRNDAPIFEGGALIAVLRNITLDLTRAGQPEDDAMLTVFSLMSDVTVRVPRGWRVTMGGLPIFSDHEDKTEPSSGPNAPTLCIQCISLMGSASVCSEDDALRVILTPAH
jgi:hypothetical protein